MKLLVFDLDDTLFCERDYVFSGFLAIDKWVRSLDAAPLNRSFYSVATELFEQGTRGNIFNLALQKLGIEETPERIQKMLEVYRTHSPSISLFEDARWVLSHFADWPLGIITDGYLAVQQRKAKALNLANYVETILYTDFYGRDNWKPSAVPYQEMMNATSMAGTHCIYVGDNPKKDFVTARALGWQTIHICRENAEYANLIVEPSFQADIKIESLYELSDLI